MIEISFPPPTRPWSTNDERRWHWAKRSRTVRAWRDTTAWAARAARFRRPLGASVVTIVVPFSRNGRRDPMNYVGTVLKACVDGLVDAGCWPDDTPEFVEIRQPALEVGDEVQIRILPR